MKPTDQQLQLALAKMLPKKIQLFHKDGVDIPEWKESLANIKETEWLHVCWLIEETLDHFQYYGNDGQNPVKGYVDHLFEQLTISRPHHASWQQRALALCKVKGITP